MTRLDLIIFIFIGATVHSCAHEQEEDGGAEADMVHTEKSDSAYIEKTDSVIVETDPFVDSLNKYFSDPLNLFEVKKNTQHMHTGYSRLLDENLLHQSKDSGTILYNYWAVEFLRTHPDYNYSLQFITRKPWTTKTERSYETDNEELIGIESIIAWDGLEQSNFVGQSAQELKQKFGYPQEEKKDCLIYVLQDKILILHLSKEKVNWFKYYWLSETLPEADQFPDYFFTWNNP